MNDLVFLERLEFCACHGVSDAERAIVHRFQIDVELELDLRPAAAADDLARTVDYAAAADRLVAIGAGPPVRLLETLAERMAADLLAWDQRIQGVRVRLRKLLPPMAATVAASGVEILRRR